MKVHMQLEPEQELRGTLIAVLLVYLFVSVILGQIMFGNEHTPNPQDNKTGLLLTHIICLSWAGCSSAPHCLLFGTQADRAASVWDITSLMEEERDRDGKLPAGS